MKKRKQKGWLLLLTLAMLAAFCVPAFAEETGSTKETTETQVRYRPGWVKDANGAYHWRNEDGSYITTGGWKTLNGKKYYLDTDGTRMTGLVTVGRRLYYLHPSVTTGLITIKGETYLFDEKTGAALKAWQTINKKKYYFRSVGTMAKKQWVKYKEKFYYVDETGAMVTGPKWLTVKGKTYYIQKNGTRVTGEKKIGKKTYYFNSSGAMQTGTVTTQNTTYYLDENGVMEAKKVNSTYYYANGTKMTSVQSNDFATLQMAKYIVSQITTSNMTQAQKLEKCFRWVISKPYATKRVFTNFEGWPAVYANDHFANGNINNMNGGNCLSDGAAFAYLAKALGYTNVYVCADSTGTHAHGWAEINGLVYDPLFAEAKSFSRNYAATYRVYTLYPVVHIAI